jgi:hypothetical protein
MEKQFFLKSTLREKILCLKEKGNYLATRTTENYYVRLYTLGSSYIEVWSSSHLPWQDVVKIKLLNDFLLLKPYLPSVFFAQKQQYTL